LLPYKNTKLRRRRRGKEALGGNIHATGRLRILRQASLGDGALAPSHHPPFLKKPALRLCPLIEEKEEKEKKKKSSIWRLITMLVNIELATVL